ncbi:MAG TPA: hypothetical protein EYH16_02350 [Leucothrix mucor]|nr:hypothetical protein [Leucothrix mucor]
MITTLFFVIFGYFVMKHSRPLIFAGVYAGMAMLIPLLMGAPLTSLLISSVIIFIYTSFIYLLVDRFGDEIVMPLSILFGGAAFLLIAPIFL